jgi:DNA-binding SARP family transcriptional activator
MPRLGVNGESCSGSQLGSGRPGRCCFFACSPENGGRKSGAAAAWWYKPVVEFRVLGPLEVREGSRIVPIGRPLSRLLLGYLLLHANEPASAERLIDELWGETPPRTAVASLQNHVSRLRKAVGTDRLRLETRGYVLRVGLDELDSMRFEALIGEAEQARADIAAMKLRQALALWRGEPFAEFAYQPFVDAARQRLEEMRLAALERRIEADLALGRDESLVAELERLVQEHPFRERLRGLVMVALYRAGRQADALGVYRETRAALVQELGIEPSPKLQALERAILNQAPELDPRLERSLERGVSANGTNLPSPPTPVLGRADELDQVVGLFRATSARLVTLTGPGRVGKTRLAIEAARRLQGDYPDGVWFVDLSPIAEAALVVSTIAMTFGVSDVGAYVADKRMLVLLDNFEQVVAASSEIATLLHRGPDVQWLVTSRERLRLTDEREYAIPPLSLGSAIELFRQRAVAAREEFWDSDDALSAVCRRLEGIPLALELAAARVRCSTSRACLRALTTGSPF